MCDQEFDLRAARWSEFSPIIRAAVQAGFTHDLGSLLTALNSRLPGLCIEPPADGSSIVPSWRLTALQVLAFEQGTEAPVRLGRSFPELGSSDEEARMDASRAPPAVSPLVGD